MSYFKYKIEKNGWTMYTPENISQFKKFMYRLGGYKVVETNDDYWRNHRVDDNKKTNVRLEIKY